MTGGGALRMSAIPGVHRVGAIAPPKTSARPCRGGSERFGIVECIDIINLTLPE